METTRELVQEIRNRAEVAQRQDGDATVHHSAVAAMLRDIADRAEAAYVLGYRVLQEQLCRLTDVNVKLTAENEKLKKHLRDAVKLAESISVTVCREGREEELHPADKSPMVRAWKLAIGEGDAE